jgi:HNH endonuclease
MQRCRHKARTANRPRLYSQSVIVRLVANDVFAVLDKAQGRCCYCNSLAVEHRPSSPNGNATQWAHVGRRIGSLEHIIPRIDGGDNSIDNLAWACLWCNTWPAERIWNATDHGATLPDDMVTDISDVREVYKHYRRFVATTPSNTSDDCVLTSYSGVSSTVTSCIVGDSQSRGQY